MAQDSEEVPDVMGKGGQSVPIATAIDETLKTHPEILDSLKGFFVKEIVKVGMAVGMFDMGTVSLGLTLQGVAHTPLVWLPISVILYTGTGLILKRVMK